MQAACPGVVVVVGGEVEVAVVEEGHADDQNSSEEEDARVDDAALDQLRTDGSEEGDDERSGPEDQAGVDGAVSVERLQDLRDHGGGGEESEAEDEVEGAGDGEVADFEQMQIDDGVGLVPLPEEGGAEAGDGDDEHPDDEGGAEPVIDLSAIEEDFEGRGTDADECNADAVDAEFAVLTD